MQTPTPLHRQNAKLMRTGTGKHFTDRLISNANYPHGCFIYTNGDIYFQQTARTTACNSGTICLQYGGKGDRHPNCKNCPAGKFGGPIGSWSPGLCETCPPGNSPEQCGYRLRRLSRPVNMNPVVFVTNVRMEGTLPIDKFSVQGVPRAKIRTARLELLEPLPVFVDHVRLEKANNVEGADCLDCIAGYVQPSVGQSLCIICGKQEWQNLNGQTTCKTCGIDSPYAGNYGHVGARDTCEYCGTGHVVPSGGTNQGACTACLVG